MSRLIALIVAVVLIIVAPAAILSWELSVGLRRDLRARDAAVRVRAGPLGLVTGRVGRLDFRAREAVLSGLDVSEVHGSLVGVTLDPAQAWRGHLVVRSATGGSVTVVVRDADLERHLISTRGMRTARVRMDDGIVAINGTVVALNSAVDVAVRARLSVADRRHLVLRIAALTIGGVTIPADVGNVLAAAVNPVLTAPQTPVPLTLTGVLVDNGRAVITAEPAR